ncbi:hypothetical protein K503DRAFT_220152 [Rhizopogon vinicolor AM-OR11-026]|uniref:Uncharacterized protein n=1 Tax=Rhizopogon vinicolor AM-OR11-026 TaxID=1314800 RepID=A0A1B7MYH4_9AGAM|nr:hypothetical protein K503DRAFT_220152 [Rhizopogon vinicolor AM-OR11-026]
MCECLAEQPEIYVCQTFNGAVWRCSMDVAVDKVQPLGVSRTTTSDSRFQHFHKFNHWDSYPENLGVKTLDSTRYPDAITSKRQQLGEALYKFDDREQLDEDGNFKLSKDRPQNDLLMYWIYELDLDHNIFHINADSGNDNDMMTAESYQ